MAPRNTELTLTTARLSIEPLAERDIDAFTEYRRDPDVARFQSWDTDYSRADAERLVTDQPDGRLPSSGSWLQLAVRETGSDVLLGDLALHRLEDQPDTFEVGVTLARSSRGRGIATEALAALLDHLFDDEHAHRVVAFCDLRNDAVARLLTHSGFRQESRQVDADWFKGAWTTLDGYALLARERSGVARSGTRP
ncbi:N-acetyltransferase [Curtobacterium sp. MCJR17_055]|uniref:GNAT family N-acetyltransferase n=1 Tax=unclassified Curtobacterium TaxID=257496 RepID=UPI000D9EB675|nr:MULTISPECIES: GNAT family N-acetyltransferase [unclassified Curtobacterium]PYY33292.1 N-acetyltransferase [Curtobacterium sp. MCBD17_029]PYY53235.1 N-acetyltransferase [Curtobacterium sp. MCJR17_055]PYY56390.1 N-acetyltransferase [Curtobacterium sp. MCPF17_015]WIB35681.1 GNAT family N-acetyltransferase [Curtobacterium sp. MCJR17_043]